LATPNYGYEKRQRELAKKKKKEEKARAKATGKPYDESGQDSGDTNSAPDQARPAAAGEGGSGTA
jgi:hypothetical protein